jgi:hypothetical protein
VPTPADSPWRIGITPNAMGRAGTPLTKRLFHGYFRDTGRYFYATDPRAIA